MALFLVIDHGHDTQGGKSQGIFSYIAVKVHLGGFMARWSNPTGRDRDIFEYRLHIEAKDDKIKASRYEI